MHCGTLSGCRGNWAELHNYKFEVSLGLVPSPHSVNFCIFYRMNTNERDILISKGWWWVWVEINIEDELNKGFSSSVSGLKKLSNEVKPPQASLTEPSPPWFNSSQVPITLRNENLHRIQMNSLWKMHFCPDVKTQRYLMHIITQSESTVWFHTPVIHKQDTANGRWQAAGFPSWFPVLSQTTSYL